ncbi:MAG: hypothetical protein IPP15_01300 [Saprospiraceae bacterium]|uniref:Uncharacterized protein n=1 Tax=Candidatus Opimibacter skivensis TaxID=2982028 RepID=A0A9D7XRT7_9BACT|nr:hypothetical protein [Candidatus Opimibacter skivensis]
MTHHEIISNEKLNELFLGLNQIEDPAKFLDNTTFDFEFSIRNTFGLSIYEFVANIKNHSLFNGSIQNGQVIIEFGPPIKGVMPQKITLTMEVTKTFNLTEVYENLVFEIKRFGLNTKVETSHDENKYVTSESTTYLSSPQDPFITIGLYYSLEMESVNHFVAVLTRVFDNEILNPFLSEFYVEL